MPLDECLLRRCGCHLKIEVYLIFEVATFEDGSCPVASLLAKLLQPPFSIDSSPVNNAFT